jgi:integrase
MPKLTVAAVRNYRPRAQRYEIADTGTGLRLVVHPTGRKSWIIRYRRPNGKSAKLTLGTCDDRGVECEPVMGGHLTLAAARKLAAEVNHDRARGNDPGVKVAPSPSLGVNSVIDKFIERYAKQHTRPSTVETYQGILNSVANRWSGRKITDITKRDVLHVLDDYTSAGKNAMAVLVLAALSKLFAWAITRDIVAVSPCTGIDRPAKPKPRERVLDDGELGRVWAAARELGYPAGPIIQLLILTGARVREIAGMRRSELNGPVWTLPSERSKNGRSLTLLLPATAQEIIVGLPRIGSGYLFTYNGVTPVDRLTWAKEKLDRLCPLDRPWVIHDLRRTTATGLASLEVQPHIVEAILNHKGGVISGVAATYNRHPYFEEAGRALEAWASHVVSTTGQTS